MTKLKNTIYRKHITFFILGTLLFSACTLKLMYQHADWMLIWSIDDYFDLDMQQRAFLDERIKNQLRWHKQHELPTYAILLRELQQKGHDGISPSEIDWVFANIKLLQKNIVQQAAADSALFLSQIKEDQIRYLESQLAIYNKSRLKIIKKSPEERLQHQAKEIFEFMEEWFGKLSADQKKQITHLSRSIPDTMEARFNFRKQRQKEFVALLRSSNDTATIEARLLKWYLDLEAGYPPEYRQLVEERRKHVKTMIFAIDKLLTPQQRQHVNDKIEGIIDDIASLSTS